MNQSKPPFEMNDKSKSDLICEPKTYDEFSGLIDLPSHNMWVETRIMAIEKVVNEHFKARCIIPEEWVWEYNSLTKQINLKYEKG